MAFNPLWLLWALLALILIYVLCWLLPKWYVRLHAPTANGPERLGLELSVVDMVVKLLGGGFVLVSLLLQSTQFLAQQKADAEQRAQQAQKEAHSARELRFNDAVSRIGDSDPGMRVAGIYALEELAAEAPEYHWKLTDIVTAMLRSHAPVKRELASAAASTPLASGSSQLRQPADVQTALLVLGRRDLALEKEGSIPERFSQMNAYYDPAKYERVLRQRLGLAAAPPKDPGGKAAVRPWLDLSYTSLANADLTMQHFEGANFEGADLSGARLNSAYLESALLWSATLNRADLSNADLRSARFWDTEMQGADLSGANLTGATFWLADMRGCDLREADFSGADLRKAHLEGANLSGAKNLSPEELAKAITDATTIMP